MFYRSGECDWNHAETMDEVMGKVDVGGTVGLCSVAVLENSFEGLPIRSLAPVVQTFRVILFEGGKALLPLPGPTMPEHGGWPGMGNELPAPILEVDGVLVNV